MPSAIRLRCRAHVRPQACGERAAPLSTQGRALHDAIRAHAPSAVTLLDIGAGVGALTLELLEAGVAQATVVDASSAFLEVGRDEAARRKVDERIEWRHADFVDVAPSLPSVDVVALDRVVCCYPAIDELLTSSEPCAHLPCDVISA